MINIPSRIPNLAWQSILFGTAAAVAVLFAGCTATPEAEVVESTFRAPGPRPDKTIFSPLDLPAPNAMRLASGAPGPEYWQQRADYEIDVTLDTQTHALSATQSITYTNNSSHELDYIWMHLEQNVFRKDSIGARRRGEGWVNADDDEKITDGFVIHSMRDGNGNDLEYQVYDTMARIDLDEPIAPGGTQFEINLEWDCDIPQNVFRRFGIEHVEQGTIYELAQWFPAVAVYDDVYGWNTLPYVGMGEFYTNFGDYDVKITVPRSHIVAATGVLQNTEEVYTREQVERIAQARASDDTVVIITEDEVGTDESRPAGEGDLTWHFKAEDVRTVAWASSDAFIYDGCNAEGVFIQSVYPKEATKTWTKSTQMLRTALLHYHHKWYPYPYPEATNVNGPEGGMEYPMIIFCGGRRNEAGLFGVTSHEIGHNWFPMLVNTDERRHAWMDEGFDSFMNEYADADWFGADAEGDPRYRTERLVARMTEPDQPPIDTHADKLNPRYLGWTQYRKTAAGLLILREYVLGHERFDAGFKTYIERWAFKSPRPADFYRTMEDATGQDLAWFFRGWFQEVTTIDQAIHSVTSEPVDDDESLTKFIVLIDNVGELPMPVEVEVTRASGEIMRERLPIEIWHATNQFEFTFKTDEPIASVVLDPDDMLPDVNRDDNIWRNPDFIDEVENEKGGVESE